MGNGNGLDFVAGGIDARPYDMPVLAAFLDVKHHGPRLADKFKAALGAGYQVEILFAGEGALGRVGIERKAVIVFLFYFCGASLRGPFSECAGEILRDGAAHVGNFNKLVVERVHQVGRKLLPAAALIALEDHNPSCGRAG